MRFEIDNPPMNWKYISIEEVCNQVTSGGTPSRKKPEYFENGTLPWIKTKELNNWYIRGTEEQINEEALKKSSAKLLPKNTVLLAMYGATVGELGITDREMTCNQACCAMLVNESRADFRFVFYTLLNFKKQIKSLATGAAQQNLSGKTIKEFEFCFPSINQQHQIADTLENLDKKIELNRQINQTLEDMAQALFKSWFVDFDPVKAKIEVLEQGGNEQEAVLAAMSIISGKSEDELEVMKNEKPEEYSELESTAKLFPSSMVESELGLIPDGWKFSPFEDNLSKTIGGDWGKEEPDEKHQEKVKIIRGTDLPNLKSGKDSTPLRYVESKKLKSRELMHGDIVIEVSGGSPKQPTGRSILITKTLKKNIGLRVEPASFCRLFRPKSEELSYLISCHLEYIYNDGKMWGYQNQSTGISNFQTKVFLSKEMLVIPCNKVLRLFSQQIKPILSMKYESETKNLEDLRDSLLPKLLSGEIEVANA